MTTMLDRDVEVSPRTRRRRFQWPPVIAGIVILAVIAAGIGSLVYVDTYQPLSQDVNSLSGPATDKTVQQITDGFNDTYFILVGPTGTRGVVDYTFGNLGRFPVKIAGLDRSEAPGIADVRWSYFAPDPTHEDELGLVSESRPFPVTLKPNQSIVLQVAVTQPRCGPTGAFFAIGGVPLKWSALGVHHVWNFTMAAAQDGAMPILLCPDKAELAHIDKF